MIVQLVRILLARFHKVHAAKHLHAFHAYVPCRYPWTAANYRVEAQARFRFFLLGLQSQLCHRLMHLFLNPVLHLLHSEFVTNLREVALVANATTLLFGTARHLHLLPGLRLLRMHQRPHGIETLPGGRDGRGRVEATRSRAVSATLASAHRLCLRSLLLVQLSRQVKRRAAAHRG